MKILKKEKNKDFVILNLSDIQIDPNEWIDFGSQYLLLKKTLKQLIEKYNPDLITITGDLCYREQYEQYRLFTQFINSFNIPWAPIFGNHDCETTYEATSKQGDILLTSSTCLFEKGEENLGCGNYVISIVNDEGKTIEGLIFMDTHDRVLLKQEGKPERLVYDTLNENQLKWYKKQIEFLKENNCKDSALFFIFQLIHLNSQFKIQLKKKNMKKYLLIIALKKIKINHILHLLIKTFGKKMLKQLAVITNLFAVILKMMVF